MELCTWVWAPAQNRASGAAKWKCYHTASSQISVSVLHRSKRQHFRCRRHYKLITSNYNTNYLFHLNFTHQYFTKHTAIPSAYSHSQQSGALLCCVLIAWWYSHLTQELPPSSYFSSKADCFTERQRECESWACFLDLRCQSVKWLHCLFVLTILCEMVRDYLWLHAEFQGHIVSGQKARHYTLFEMHWVFQALSCSLHITIWQILVPYLFQSQC